MIQCVVINSSPVPGYAQWDSTSKDDKRARSVLAHWGFRQCRDCRRAEGLQRCDLGDEDDQFTAFFNSFCDIAELPVLQKVRMNFNPECATEVWATRTIGFEYPQQRDELLFRLFRALRQRSTDPNVSTVTSLSIYNLQNTSLFPDTLKQLKYVTSTIEHLELLVTEECNYSDGADTLQYPETRLTFVSHLVQTWLSPSSSRLRSLKISFHFYWGALPSRFSGADLNFPQLQELTLDKYCLSHDKSIDWVLRQKSLKHLCFHNCAIGTYFKLHQEYIEACDVYLEDWQHNADILTHWPSAEFSPLIYRYSTTWAYFLERIRNELHYLKHFVRELNAEGSRYVPHSFYGLASDRTSMPAYIAFDSAARYPGPWTRPSCHDFRGIGECNHCELCRNSSSRIERDDTAALARLREDIARRRRLSSSQ